MQAELQQNVFGTYQLPALTALRLLVVDCTVDKHTPQIVITIWGIRGYVLRRFPLINMNGFLQKSLCFLFSPLVKVAHTQFTKIPS